MNDFGASRVIHEVDQAASPEDQGRGYWSHKGDYQALGFPQSRLTLADEFIEPVLVDGALPARIKLLILYILGAVNGNRAVAEFAFEEAARHGLSREEFGDGLLAGSLSRGIGVFLTGAPLLKRLPAFDDEHWGNEPQKASRSEMLRYFEGAHGEPPPAVEQLAEAAPRVFESYFGLRSVVLADGALPRRYKELSVAANNMLNQYEWGLELHLRAAVDAGASRDECVETILTAMVLGGIPLWLETAPILDRVLAGGDEVPVADR